ncbi:hypothetical protein [Iningainema tapete]|nr:hypothetical protein [Iningainema tapete]
MTIVLCSCLFIAGLNLMIDPFGFMGSPAIAGLNKFKTEREDYPRLFKAADIIRIKPKTIFLGTSTTDYSLEPNHPGLANLQPAYNSALPAVNMYELMRYFEHTLYNQPELKQVIIGIDAFIFDQYRPNRVDYDEQRLLTNKRSYHDMFNVTFSMNAFLASLKTIGTNLHNSDFQPYAFNGKRNENWFTNSKPAIYRFISSLNRDLPEIITLSDERFNNFKKVIEVCRERNIDVKVFMPPLHASVMAGYVLNDKIKVIEETKRRLVNIIPVWDFSGFNSITIDPVSNNMKNYVDAFHYRREIGNLVLNRLLNFQTQTVPSDFGYLMKPENIDTHFAEIRSQAKNWLKDNSELAKLLQEVGGVK